MSAGLAREILRRVVPDWVHTAEIEDRGQAIALREGERNVVAVAGARRVRDFTLGRDCAHRALTRMGKTTGAILRQGNGAPLWPAGILGSITHTDGFAAAAVARATDADHIGIDAERVAELADNVASQIFVSEELAYLETLMPQDRAVAAITLFSAKEACFKACATAPLKFREMQVRLVDEFFFVNTGERTLTGRWAMSGDLVVTAVSVPAN